MADTSYTVFPRRKPKTFKRQGGELEGGKEEGAKKQKDKELKLKNCGNKMSRTQPYKTCSSCRKPAKKACSKCHAAYYCTVEVSFVSCVDRWTIKFGSPPEP